MWHEVINASEVFSKDKWNISFFVGSENKINLVENNSHVMLGDICKESKKATDPQLSPNTLFRYFGLENVESHSGIQVGELNKSGKDIKSRSKYVPNKAVLYGRLRPTLNKVYFKNDELSQCICSGEFIVLIADESKILPRVLREVLASNFVLSEVNRFIAGAALPRIMSSDLLSIKIPLPPLNIQKEIQEKLFDLDIQRLELRKQLNEIPNKYISSMSRFWD